MKHGQANIR